MTEDENVDRTQEVHPAPKSFEPDQPEEKEPPGEGRFPTDGFTVVGVGASAGGLEAFEDFLKALPADTGMAFVLLQHLDPHHESILAGLLAHRTYMPVKQVQEDTPVEANHLYVIPPNKTMVISYRTLKLSPRTARERHMPIDTFFVSLAEEMGANSIGIILSGAASDGTLGLKAIKNAGGITFCQDGSAKFDSMPRSAAAVGAVDFVLPPAKIAAEIASIARHPYYVKREQFAVAQDGAELDQILRLLRNATAVDFREYKRPTIQRRLIRRMALEKIENLDEYRRFLEKDPQELESLFDDLLINVTEFFRDPGVFETLKKMAIPSLIKDHKSGEPIRVWVPACSSGEEMYSIGICLVEYLEENQLDHPIRMFGTDVSDRIIDRARTGLYSGAIVSSLSPERLRRFFVKADSGYQINRTIRDLCIFSKHNIAQDPPLSRMDLISCRNLLIYLKTSLQKRVISRFGYALQPSGCLILGTSESPGPLGEHFSALDLKHKIFCLKPNLNKSVFEIQTDFDQEAPRPRVPNQRLRELLENDASHEIRRYVDQMFLVEYGPSALLVDHNFQILEIRGDANRFLIQATDSKNRDLFGSVRSALTTALRHAIKEAQEHETTIKTTLLPVREKDVIRNVRLVVVPIRLPASPQFLLILFEESEDALSEAGKTTSQVEKPEITDPIRHILHLEQELSSTRQYLQATIEELRSANEEEQSTNEELQSTNEELQTAKEEMQSSNEELSTINSEMASRNLELAQVNDDLTNLLSSMNMPVIMVDQDLRLRRFTPMAESVLHLIPTDIGRPILDLQPRISVANLEKIIRQVLDSLIPHEEEVRDEQGRSYLLRVRPYRAARNRIDGTVLQLLDVGELKRSLETARQARDYAQTIVDTVREPLIVFNDSLVAQDANRSFYQYFQMRRSDVIGKPLADILPGDLSAKLQDALAGLIGANTAIQDKEFDQKIEGKGARTFVVNATRMPIGETTRVLVAFEDVTERKQAAEARYRQLFESARDAMVIVDSETAAIVDVNPSFEQLFGYNQAELTGKRLGDLEPLKAIANSGGLLRQLAEEGVARFPDVTLDTSDGRRLQVEIIGNTYWEGNRRLAQVNIRDLTERRRFERELQHTARLESLGILAGGIAHDFNNLLTGILGNASLLFAEAPPGDPNRGPLRDVMRSAERAAQLTQQMLAYAGKGRVQSETIRVPDFIEDVLGLVKAAIPKTVEISVNCAADTPEVVGDPGQLQQLLMNLIINGAEAIGDDRAGRVEVSARCAEVAKDGAGERSSEPLEPGSYLVIEVRDTGSGMDESTLAKIFDPFFTTKFTGRGLGLAAALGIARGHRGALRVSSKPGRGSSFRIFLPAKPDGATRNAGSTGVPQTGKGTILVIDDEPSVRDVAQRSLGSLGYRVLTAEDGRNGFALFEAHKDEVDLILLDLRMPVMGGEETLDRIRAVSNDVPVLLLSGYDESEAVRQFGARPKTSFLHKPYTYKFLAETVARLLNEHKPKR